MGNYKSSRAYLSAYVKLSDSLTSLKRANSSKDEEMQYQLNDTLEKNSKMFEKLEKAEDDNSLSTLISILSVALITILSLLTLSLYKNNNIRLKANKYDIVLMDIHMPGISGIEATKIVRSFDKDQIIFALTAVTIEDKMHEFEEAGFTAIIPKPFRKEEFEKKLYKALTSKKRTSTTS